MKREIILLSILLSTCYASAQEPIPRPHIREADQMWSMRIWRELDLRQKINQPLYFPLVPHDGYASLYTVMMRGIKEKYVKAYGTGPLGNRSDFIDPLSQEEINALLVKRDTISTPGIDTDKWIQVTLVDSITPAKIARYRIMEDWIFDRQRSMMIPVIRAIAPMKEEFGPDGASRGFTILFWIDFEELRPYLSQSQVYLRQNDNHALSYDDLFIKRYFSGRIVKESNVYDRSIADYAQGVDALLEGEQIEEKIRRFESDLWNH